MIRQAQRFAPSRYLQGDKRHVVILPGVYETWRPLRAIANELNRRGHPVHLVHSLGFNRDPIPASSKLVALDIATLGLTGVALVAHSKGGLIGKHLLTYQNTDERVDRLVAVATPFGGSKLARYTMGSTLRAFLPSDPVIRALAGETTVNGRITSIYPRFDPNIPEGSSLEGAKNVEIPILGHFRILTSKAAIKAVAEAVEA